MSLFDSVKKAVTTREAAEHYGVRVGRNGMCRCPFHSDHDPSMKVDKRFHCFGCHADGDVVDFAARLFDLWPLFFFQQGLGILCASAGRTVGKRLGSQERLHR